MDKEECTVDKGALFVDEGHLLYKRALTVDKGVLLVDEGHLLNKGAIIVERGHLVSETYSIFLCENKMVPLN